MKRINELGDYRLIEPDLSHTFDLNPEFVKYLSASNCVHIFFSYFHPQFPSFFLDLATRGVKVSLVFSEDVYSRYEEDFKKEGEEFLKLENTSISILNRKDIEIPALITSTNKIMILGLFNESGRFDRQYITSFEKEAIKWGEELFQHYRNMSREIKLN